MPRPLRHDHEGAWHHVINRGVARTPVFVDDLDREYFFEVLQSASSSGAVEIHAYCLMTNHYHLLVRSREGRLSKAMQLFSSKFTHKFNRRHKRDGPLFRGRFTAIGIGTDAHLTRMLRYIHLNPVEAGLVQRPCDWQWSSAAAYENGPRPAWLETSALLSMFTSSGHGRYEHFIEQGVDETTRDFYRNLAMGSDPWV